ncbi:MAG: hypothetical protein HOF69_01515 [Campylobacteraceae bacterium]|jgi:hypothetical protein|nr:hypothetical protein [Campylobacteraceae bacterium]MBT3881920.1 hypothetical protein [Campylobacteraceae bacterium]MBT4030786.1 hypothetical protein [Campylobacteraceae bacterium]MBT4178723.1 hypothetical protein [Campylobacteraceae bacterium]MBT4572086.1 hypothetical protein [Campylobacteraceae bacterium]
MDNKEKAVIKAVIETLMKDRQKEFSINANKFAMLRENHRNHHLLSDLEKELISKKKNDLISEFDNTIKKLNELLDLEDRSLDVKEFELNIKEIQDKKYINVKEFQLVYGYSPEWQKNRRSRMYNTLPYIQTVEGGKITYNVKDVNIWFENENIVL